MIEDSYRLKLIGDLDELVSWASSNIEPRAKYGGVRGKTNEWVYEGASSDHGKRKYWFRIDNEACAVLMKLRFG